MSALTQVSWFLPVVFLTEAFVSIHNVSYVMTPHFNFFIANGKTVRSQDAKHILTRDISNCTCKQACFAIDCMAWSVVVQQDGKNECRLDTEGPTTRTLEDNPDATYFFREDSIPGKYQLSTDNLLYVVLDEDYHFYEGKRMCSRIPGHRLVIIKTLIQLDIIKHLKDSYDLGEFIALDLEKKYHSSEKNPALGFNKVWGDGTPYNETQLPTSLLFDHNGVDEDIYILHFNRINDYLTNRDNRIICQANPLGVEW